MRPARYVNALIMGIIAGLIGAWFLGIAFRVVFALIGVVTFICLIATTL